MAQATYLQVGSALDYTPSVDTPAGTVIGLGTIATDESGVGVNPNDIAADELGAIEVEGVYTMDKEGGVEALTRWQPVYWDNVNKVIVSAATGDTFYAGRVSDDADIAADKVNVKLNVK